MHFSIENVYIYGNSMWKILSDENLFAEKIDYIVTIYMRSFVTHRRRLGPFNYRVRVDKSSVPIRYSNLVLM